MRWFDSTASLRHSWHMADEKPRREIRIPVPDFAEVGRKASEVKDQAMVATGAWHRRHPILASVIFVVVLQFIIVLIRQG